MGAIECVERCCSPLHATPTTGRVVAQHERALLAHPGEKLRELEGEQAAVGAELDDIALDLQRDAQHHLATLRDHRDIAHGDEVVDLQGGEVGAHLVESHAVALERRDGLVGAGEDRAGVLQDVAPTVDVDRDGRHGLADADRGVECLTRDPVGGAVARARLVGGECGIGVQVHGCAQDARRVVVEDDRAVHLGEFAQSIGGELDVEGEAAARDDIDRTVKAEDDERSGATAEDALEAVAQWRARSDHGQHVAKPGLRISSHAPPCPRAVSLVRWLRPSGSQAGVHSRRDLGSRGGRPRGAGSR